MMLAPIAARCSAPQVVRAFVVNTAKDEPGFPGVGKTLDLPFVLKQRESAELPAALTKHTNPARHWFAADRVSLKETSEFEPHLTIVAGAAAGTVHVIINGLHPYYVGLESTEATDECIRQYIYDAIAEYRTGKLSGRVNPDSVRRLKNDLLRVQAVKVENAAANLQDQSVTVMVQPSAPPQTQ